MDTKMIALTQLHTIKKKKKKKDRVSFCTPENCCLRLFVFNSVLQDNHSLFQCLAFSSVAHLMESEP